VAARGALSIVDCYRPRTPRAFLERVVAAARAEVRRPDLEVSLLLTDDAELAGLHGCFLDDPSPTDVLSFPGDGAVDIAVSVERARRIARERGHAIRAELALYVVHGILHACGHDDGNARARSKMRAAEARVLGALRLRCAPVDE
jgi:probable rRNA maturation factor